MHDLKWSPKLMLGEAEMDTTHEEFVAMVAAVRSALRAGDTGRAARQFERLVYHTEDHFAQEERWMQLTRFPHAARHIAQHDGILQLMHRTVRTAGDAGRRGALNELVRKLTRWFPEHAVTLDAELAAHVKSAGLALAATEFGTSLRAVAAMGRGE